MFYKFATIILLVFSQVALAQISITSSDILALIGKTQTLEFDSSGSVAVDVGTTGGNQNWNFSNIPVQLEQTAMFLNPAGTPFAEDYPTANFVQLYDLSSGDTVLQFYTYGNVTSSLFKILGGGRVFKVPGEIDTSIAESDNEENPLPITYQAEWSSSSIDTSDFGEVLFISEDNSESVVDAWGTVTIPAGTFDCLRIRDNYTIVSKTMVGDMVLFSDSSSGIDYTWVSKNSFLVASIESEDGETNPNFSQAAYFNRLGSGQTALEDESKSALLSDFSLDQNYPNPFNPVTTITYSIGIAENVKLSIYDNAGKLVTNLVNEHQAPGNHSIQWNAGGLASGVYYYKILSGNFSDIRKSILMK